MKTFIWITTFMRFQAIFFSSSRKVPSTTVYNIVGAAPIMVPEVTEASERSDIVSLSLKQRDELSGQYTLFQRRFQQGL